MITFIANNRPLSAQAEWIRAPLRTPVNLGELGDKGVAALNRLGERFGGTDAYVEKLTISVLGCRQILVNFSEIQKNLSLTPTERGVAVQMQIAEMLVDTLANGGDATDRKAATAAAAEIVAQLGDKGFTDIDSAAAKIAMISGAQKNIDSPDSVGTHIALGRRGEVWVHQTKDWSTYTDGENRHVRMLDGTPILSTDLVTAFWLERDPAADASGTKSFNLRSNKIASAMDSPDAAVKAQLTEIMLTFMEIVRHLFARFCNQAGIEFCQSNRAEDSLLASTRPAQEAMTATRQQVVDGLDTRSPMQLLPQSRRRIIAARTGQPQAVVSAKLTVTTDASGNQKVNAPGFTIPSTQEVALRTSGVPLALPGYHQSIRLRISDKWPMAYEICGHPNLLIYQNSVKLTASGATLESEGDTKAFIEIIDGWQRDNLTLYRGISSNHFSWDGIRNGQVKSEGAEDVPKFTMGDGPKTSWLPTAHRDAAGKNFEVTVTVAAGNRCAVLEEVAKGRNDVIVGAVLSFSAGASKGRPICFFNSGETGIQGPVSFPDFRIAGLLWEDDLQSMGFVVRPFPAEASCSELPKAGPYFPLGDQDMENQRQKLGEWFRSIESINVRKLRTQDTQSADRTENTKQVDLGAARKRLAPLAEIGDDSAQPVCTSLLGISGRDSLLKSAAMQLAQAAPVDPESM